MMFDVDVVGSVEDKLAEAVERLREALQPELIYLFGSLARGDADEDSDVDLLVIVADSPLSAFKRAQLAYRALYGVGIAKDVLVWTRAEFERRRHLPASFAATVLREGRLLYAA